MIMRTTHLLVRQHLALVSEGIGPRYPRDTDTAVLAAAVEAVQACADGAPFTVHELWYGRLLDDKTHDETCDCDFAQAEREGRVV